MLTTTSNKTNFCPKHGMRRPRDITADSKPSHLNGLRYDKNLFMPTSTSTLKPSSANRVVPPNNVLQEVPNGRIAPMVAPKKALMDENSSLVAKPRALDENFLASSQKELRDRVKSIEKTLDHFGSRASLRSVGSEARINPANARNSRRTMPVYKPDKHIQRTQPPHYSSSQRGVTPTRQVELWKKRSNSKSPLTFLKSDYDDDEEIASLFRELETLRTPGSIAYDEPPSYRSKTPINNSAANNNRMGQMAPTGTFGCCAGHATNSIVDLNSTHHSVIGINNGQLIKGCNMPCLFRCKGCGDLQPIFTPNNNFAQFFPTSFGPGPQTNTTQGTNPLPYNFNPQSMNPMYNQIPAQNPTNPQIIFMPYYGGMPTTNSQTSPELTEILKTLSENFPKKGKNRSIGTQSVENLSQRNLDTSEEEIGVINKNDNLQSAANDLFFDDFPDESNDNLFGRAHNTKTALELRELELSAWAAAKWWNFIKQKREERRQAALDVDFEDFCRAEFPNREKLQSALDDLDFAANDLSPRNENTALSPRNEPKQEENPAIESYGLPQGFTSFKQLSAAAKASYKWAEFVEKKKRERREQGIV